MCARVVSKGAAITNRALRWARADLRGAEDELRAHTRGCIDCTRAQRTARTRKPEDRCAAGSALAATVAELIETVAEELRLSRLPIPGQLEMAFGEVVEPLDWLGGHMTADEVAERDKLREEVARLVAENAELRGVADYLRAVVDELRQALAGERQPWR